MKIIPVFVFLLAFCLFFSESSAKRKQPPPLRAIVHGVDVDSLPLNSVTFVGTHNSGAYALNMIKCTDFVQDCASGWKDSCTKQEDRCTGGWEDTCVSSTKSCASKLPSWMGWACRAWNRVCTKTERVCKGYSKVCVATSRLCDVPGPGCSLANTVASKCIVANHWGHDFGKQLDDGIRSFDIDLCSINNQLYNCHTMDYVGDLFKGSLLQIKDFLIKNPDQFIIMGFSNLHGPDTDNLITNELKQFFCRTPDCPEIYVPQANEVWPTVGNLIRARKQVLMPRGNYNGVFAAKASFSEGTYDEVFYKGDVPKYRTHVLGKCTENAAKKDILMDISGSLVQTDPRNGAKVDLKSIRDEALKNIKVGQDPQCSYCLDCLATKLAPHLSGILADCHKNGGKIFTFSLDNYWKYPVETIGKQLNLLNVARSTGNKLAYRKFFRKFKKFYKKFKKYFKRKFKKF